MIEELKFYAHNRIIKSTMSVVVRFAPSPTGYLHIGGARTALYNYLFARHHGGRFLLRIEDTDRRRSTQEAIDAILEGLHWLGLDADEPPVFQFARAEQHRQAALQLVEEGLAYRCYCSAEELETMRQKAKAEGRSRFYDGRWRDRDPSDAPAGIDPVIRFKAPLEGETVIEDAVQGRVAVANSQLDDMILLRSDGTPTYMLAVCVDDIDMGVTHIIRGDDHLNNAIRHSNLFRALGKYPPVFAHIPLIHGPDGAKLSKRHGALGVDAYRDLGYLPAALRNYLLRLGWSHGDAEIISDDEAIGWFGLEAVGRSPARFDFDKLASINAHYLKQADNKILAKDVATRLDVTDASLMVRLEAGMDGLKPRAKTLADLADMARFYTAERPLPMIPKAAKLLEGAPAGLLQQLRDSLAQAPDFSEAALEAQARALAVELDLGFGKIAQPLRAAVTGSNVSPSLFEVLAVLGVEEVLARLDDAVTGRNPAVDAGGSPLT